MPGKEPPTGFQRATPNGKGRWRQTVMVLLACGPALFWAHNSGAAPGVAGRPNSFTECLTGVSGLDAVGQAAMTFRLAAPVKTWMEGGGIPLGNGFTGGLLHGEGSRLELWLDRVDLWDERPCPTVLETGFTYRHWVELKEKRDFTELNRLFDAPWFHPTPTKLPGGQLELALDSSRKAAAFVLDLKKALARVETVDGQTAVECFYSATDGVSLLRICGPPPRRYKLAVPPVWREKLGYAAPQTGTDGKGEVHWFVQQVPKGMSYAVTAGDRRVGDCTVIALAMTASTTDGADPLTAGRERVRRALDRGFERMLQPHLAWWSKYWSVSEVRLPDELQQRHYNLVRYFLGSVSRPGCPAMPGKGVWSHGMDLPSFKGGYHGDLTLQSNYVSYPAAGHFAEGRVFIEHMWRRLPTWRKFAREFYGAPGATIPGVMSQGGLPETGCPAYALMPQGNCSWYGWMFYRHWLYTRDREFLRKRAYPFCAELGECIGALLQPDARGRLRTRISSSPEIGGNDPECYLPPNSNYDQAGMLTLFGGLAHMADELGRTGEAARWRKIVAGLGGLWVDPRTNALGFAPGKPFDQSHRHHSHLMAIHPYGILSLEGSEQDRKVIAASLRLLDRFGDGNWRNVYPWDASFAWAACIKARFGDGEGAFHNIDVACRKGTNRSGLSLDGNIMEGNFLGMEAIHEMLLQRLAGVIRVFPAVPGHWQDAAFRDLRAEGAFVVSALRKAGKTQWVRIRSEAGQPCRVRANLPGVVKVSGCTMRDLGDGTVQLDLAKGGEALLYSGDMPTVSVVARLPAGPNRVRYAGTRGGKDA
jgi:alpha-L-fucosidase 2